MPRHKVLDKIGNLQASYVESGIICHESVPVSAQQTCARKKIDASLLFVPQQSGAYSWRRTRIRKMVLGKYDIAFSKVIDELSKFYIARGRRLLACRMQLNKPKRQDVWLNPELKEQLAEIKATRSQLENNGGQARSRFFQKSLRIQEAYFAFDWGEGSGRLARELENFERDFQVFC